MNVTTKIALSTRTKIVLGVAVALAAGGLAMATLPSLQRYQELPIPPSSTAEQNPRQTQTIELLDSHLRGSDPAISTQFEAIERNAKEQIQRVRQQLASDQKIGQKSAQGFSQAKAEQNNCYDQNALAIFEETGSITCGLITWNLFSKSNYRGLWFSGDPRPYLIKYSDALASIEEFTNKTGKSVVVYEWCTSTKCEQQTGRLNRGYSMSGGNFRVSINESTRKEDLILYSTTADQPLSYVLLHEFAHAVTEQRADGGPLMNEDPALLEAWADITGPLSYIMYNGTITTPARGLRKIYSAPSCFDKNHRLVWGENPVDCADFYQTLDEIIDWYGLALFQPETGIIIPAWKVPDSPRCSDCNEGLFRIVKRPSVDDTGHGRGSTFTAILMLLYKDFLRNGKEATFSAGLKNTTQYIHGFRFGDYLKARALDLYAGTGKEHDALFNDYTVLYGDQDQAKNDLAKKVVVRRANFFIYLLSAYTGTDFSEKFKQWNWYVLPITQKYIQKLEGREPTKDETYGYLYALLNSESSCGESERPPCPTDAPDTRYGCKPPFVRAESTCVPCPNRMVYDDGYCVRCGGKSELICTAVRACQVGLADNGEGWCVLCGDNGQPACKPGENDTNGSGCMKKFPPLLKDSSGICRPCPDGTYPDPSGKCVVLSGPTFGCGYANQAPCALDTPATFYGCFPPLTSNGKECIFCADGMVYDNEGRCASCGGDGDRACFQPGTDRGYYCKPGFQVEPGTAGTGRGPKCAPQKQ